jgi:hypothetical protein
MGISSKLENSDSRKIQFPSSGGLNFEASDQLDQSSLWFNLVQLILSKFLSNFKVSVIWESGTTQVSDSIWCNLYFLSFSQTSKFRWSGSLGPLKLLIQSGAAYTNHFGAAYTNPLHKFFRCSLYFRQLILLEGVFNRSWVLTRTRGGSIRSGWVRSILLIQIAYVCCGGIIWRVYVWGQVCTIGIYDNLLGFGFTYIWVSLQSTQFFTLELQICKIQSPLKN